jgi:coenzyme F420-reducing hydrogenase alpha subunit
MGLVPDGTYGYIKGKIMTSTGIQYEEKDYRSLIEHVVLPYSQASAYQQKGESYMVGALARVNVAQDRLHPKTKDSLKAVLALFPSTDIFYNNLAQAIEIVHSIDESIDLLSSRTFVQEAPVKAPYKEATGVGVVDAPRGLLYHKIAIDAEGKVTSGEVIVPTGQNQINIEQDAGRLVQGMLDQGIEDKEKITWELEKLIRAYDPCMSCAAHFLKVKWV